jgi:hypothetical protein
MNMAKRTITVILMVFVALSIFYAVNKGMTNTDRPPAGQTSLSPDGQSAADGDQSDEETFAPVVLASDDLQSNRIQVFYFHRTIRCIGCINVEEAAFEAVSADHSANVENGSLEWRSINFDEEENAHYASRYDLYSQELILIEIRDGVPVRNTKIAEVWEHWNSKPEIRAITNRYIDEWLGGINQS